MRFKHLSFVASARPAAREAGARFIERFGNVPVEEADVIVAVGGDGFMLEVLHRYMALKLPIYGVNYGSIGFLMNSCGLDDLKSRLEAAELTVLHPLRMNATTADGGTRKALAINEVSLLRETSQSAKIKVSVDDQVRLEELMCDGVLLSTPAGSTAYNYSAHGPILPIDANVLALTPISAFRPRLWRGALLPRTAVVRFDILKGDHRPVSAVADNEEVRGVTAVTISEAPEFDLLLLFDDGHSLEERVTREQFEV